MVWNMKNVNKTRGNVLGKQSKINDKRERTHAFPCCLLHFVDQLMSQFEALEDLLLVRHPLLSVLKVDAPNPLSSLSGNLKIQISCELRLQQKTSIPL